jgi:enamine deaminase RidA (YjgF/YER057c/UK114 family)
MIQRSIEIYPAFKIFVTSIRNQQFISASVTAKEADPVRLVQEIYDRIAALLSASSSQIVHERCFCALDIQPQILETRARTLQKDAFEANTPVTFIEGESCLMNPFAGVQIRALKRSPETMIRTIMDHGIPKGRAWNLNGSTFFMLHSIDGGEPANANHADRKSRSEAMFHQADRILRGEGATFQDVVRTWIYISDILDWYNDFNVARNICYSEYGFLGDPDTLNKAEQVYLPASTGIEGKNPSGAPATMDVFAVHRTPASSIVVRPVYGTKQRSPFRYGSAFSRAVVVEEKESKLILVSGTASIDEEGKSMFIGDPAAQIRHTLDVVSSLIAGEGATLQDMCEATVFLKNREDYSTYQEIAGHADIYDAPSVIVEADVCRDELLFELDAAFILGKNTAS